MWRKYSVGIFLSVCFVNNNRGGPPVYEYHFHCQQNLFSLVPLSEPRFSGSEVKWIRRIATWAVLKCWKEMNHNYLQKNLRKILEGWICHLISLYLYNCHKFFFVRWPSFDTKTRRCLSLLRQLLYRIFRDTHCLYKLETDFRGSTLNANTFIKNFLNQHVYSGICL